MKKEFLKMTICRLGVICLMVALLIPSLKVIGTVMQLNYITANAVEALEEAQEYSGIKVLLIDDAIDEAVKSKANIIYGSFTGSILGNIPYEAQVIAQTMAIMVSTVSVALIAYMAISMAADIVHEVKEKKKKSEASMQQLETA